MASCLIFLKSNGIELSKNEEKIIVLLENQKHKLIIVRACAFGRKDSMKFLFTKKRLNSYYHWYTSLGWKGLR
jgi:hypothetical protein